MGKQYIVSLSVCVWLYAAVTNTALANTETSALNPGWLAQFEHDQVQFASQQNRVILSHAQEGMIELDLQARLQSAGQTAAKGHPTSPVNGFAQTIVRAEQSYSWLHTQGQHTAIGEITGADAHWWYVSTPEGTWTVELNGLTTLPSLYDNDTIGQPLLSSTGSQSKAHLQHHMSHTFPPTKQALVRDGVVVVDVMMLFTSNILAAYPGELAQTLMTHLINKANQAFVNSDVNVQLRLVRSEWVDYQRPSNFTAIDDLKVAVDDDPATLPVPSLASVGAWRDEVRADIVAMIRTHDLVERDVCGVAQFPDPTAASLVNISNVGISGGSNCIDTFTHEIGHNFGAGHQAIDGQSQGALDNSGALLVPGKFNTIMSSIGTGDINRNYKLNVFSNTNNQCGNRLCGDPVSADNAATVEAFALQNANLQEANLVLDTLVMPLKTFTDHDGDGVDERTDAFPFIASETCDSDNDGIGDNADRFPTDPNEVLDTDNDGLGNNSDTDDDNDGVVDEDDELPLNASESRDSDGDGVGDNTDELAFDRRDSRDNDGDLSGDTRDNDDDNDGLPDFAMPTSLAQASLVVVSANSHQLLEYDAQTGEFLGVLATMAEGDFTFRSDAIVSANQNVVYFIAQSDVYQYDRQTGTVEVYLDRSELFANFPEQLALLTDGTMLVTNDRFGFEIIQGFADQATDRPVIYEEFVEGRHRDILRLSDASLLVADYGNDQLIIVNTLQTGITPRVLANEGLSQPEQLAMASNNNILVSNKGSGDITAYRGGGDFIGTLIPAGTAGLGKPSCMLVAPGDILYVCSEDTDEMLRFDARTGQFIDTLVVAGNSPLDRPVGMTLVGKPIDPTPYTGDTDVDNDGTINAQDQFPFDPAESLDTDSDGIGNNADTDDDNDGMPDTYEDQYGFDPLDPADARQDADDDGSSNLAEYTIGSNPLVATQDELESRNSGGGSLGGGLICAWLLIAVARRLRFARLRKAA